MNVQLTGESLPLSAVLLNLHERFARAFHAREPRLKSKTSTWRARMRACVCAAGKQQQLLPGMVNLAVCTVAPCLRASRVGLLTAPLRFLSCRLQPPSWPWPASGLQRVRRDGNTNASLGKRHIYVRLRNNRSFQSRQLVLRFSFNELIFSSAGEFQTCCTQSYVLLPDTLFLWNLSQVSPCKIHPEHLMAVFLFLELPMRRERL